MTVLVAMLWQAVRLPIYTFLVILQPISTFLLGGLALLGFLMSLFFKAYDVPNFPFLTMLCISLGFGIASTGYSALLRLVSSR